MVIYCKLPVFICNDYIVFLFKGFLHCFHLVVKPIKYNFCPSVTLFTHSTSSNEQQCCQAQAGLPAPVLVYRLSPALLISNIEGGIWYSLERSDQG